MRTLVIHIGLFGDALLFRPIFDQVASLMEEPPDVLCSTGSKDVFERCENMDALIHFPVQFHEKTCGWGRWRRRRRLLGRLRKRFYKAVYDFTSSKFSVYLVKSLKARYSFGIDRKGRGHYYTVAARDPGKTVHIQERLCRIASGWGMNVAGRPPDWPCSSEEAEEVREWWRRHPYDGIRLAVHARSNSHLKNWPLEKFEDLLRRLTAGYDIRAYLIGGPQDSAINAALAANVNSRMVDLTPETKTFFHTAEFLRSMDLFIGCDSGPGHLAAAVGLPVLTIFSHHDSRYSRPLTEKGRRIEKDLACRPCKRARSCRNKPPLECLDHSVQTVYEQLAGMIEQYCYLRRA